MGSIADKARLLGVSGSAAANDCTGLLRQPDVTTLASLRSQGFSDRMIEQFFRPFVGGIQLDPSLQTSRRMFDVILQSLFSGDATVPAQGMGAIPEQLASHLPPGMVHLHTTVAQCDPARSLSPGASA